ncbi:bifunctional diaminohydroxyphosphoribosylaminopyrimidine deaminase/5-amino-6-(5-phosphoribosylamino)uracil reductase RibD [Gallibacterium trehalosifermentans]|uniref:Riboflavin biosynthesis protein RibD n=1 Tax=Gallibacterium trehalosifermentans TaxID=516935 RepID=A0ABV6H2G5_9PAST
MTAGSTDFSLEDRQFMALAIKLAKRGRFTCTPNPAVGCVLVKDGEIVGQGYHAKAGEAHAEVMAMREAGEHAKGATAYVTLEPCSHYGRTPPCAKGLIEAGVVRVVAAMQDPNPQVAGRGLKMLSDAGIITAVGLLEHEAEQLNRGFLKRMRTGLPYVQLKMAMSIDGRTAMANGESQWITGELARQDVQHYRAMASAILSTSKTVMVDDAALTVRWSQLAPQIQAIYPEEKLRQPLRIILDSHHQVLPTGRLFTTESPIWLVSSQAREMQDYPAFCQQQVLPESPYFFTDLLTFLGKQQINSVWVEAGATLAGKLIEAQLVDELIIYIAPKLLGDQARGLCHLPNLHHLADAPLWQLVEMTQIGEDIKLVYRQPSL